MHENEKERQYSSRVLDVEYGTFTPLVFTTTGRMGQECLKLIALKKGVQYTKTISWIRANLKKSFALLRSTLICLRGSRTTRRVLVVKNADFDIKTAEGAIY